MDAGKLLGLTNCCGIAVGVMGNLVTGNTCVRVNTSVPLRILVLLLYATRAQACAGLNDTLCASDGASCLLRQGCWPGVAPRGFAGCGA